MLEIFPGHSSDIGLDVHLAVYIAVLNDPTIVFVQSEKPMVPVIWKGAITKSSHLLIKISDG